MGLVYLAEQREPLVRRVALKLIKPGMDTREVLARFEAERQALALMDHPNIARVLVWTDPGSAPLVIGRGAGRVVSIAFSPDAVSVAAVWGESDAGAGVHTIERRRHDGMAAYEGSTRNTDTHDTLQVWDLESRRKVFGARRQCVHTAAFTPDDALIASDSWETPVVLRAASGGTISMRSEEMPTTMSVAFSPDGSRLTAGTGESQVVVLDARTMEALLIIRVESQFTHRVVFSADGTRLITTGSLGDKGASVVRVYDARPPREAEALTAGGAVKPVAAGGGRK